MKSQAIESKRWIAKKVGRVGCMTASFMSGSLAMRERIGSPSVRVITYHRFGEIPRDPFAVSPAMFDRQMEWLAGEGRAISLADLGDFLAGEREVRDGSILVTIDDGFRSTLTDAAPILSSHGVPAVAFITTSLVGNREAALEQPESYLEWEELAQLEAAGVVIGSHNNTHRSLAKMPLHTAGEGARASRETLSERLTGSIVSLVHPTASGSASAAGLGPRPIRPRTRSSCLSPSSTSPILSGPAASAGRPQTAPFRPS